MTCCTVINDGPIANTSHLVGPLAFLLRHPLHRKASVSWAGKL